MRAFEKTMILPVSLPLLSGGNPTADRTEQTKQHFVLCRTPRDIPGKKTEYAKCKQYNEKNV